MITFSLTASLKSCHASVRLHKASVEDILPCLRRRRVNCAHAGVVVLRAKSQNPEQALGARKSIRLADQLSSAGADIYIRHKGNAASASLCLQHHLACNRRHHSITVE